MKTLNQIDVTAGWNAYDANGDKIGSINDQLDNCLVVSKGTLFPKDIFVPTDAVKRVDESEHRVYVNVTKDQIESMGWDDPNTLSASESFGSTRDQAHPSKSAGFATRDQGTTRGYDAENTTGFDPTSGVDDATRQPTGAGSMRTQRTGYGDEDEPNR